MSEKIVVEGAFGGFNYIREAGGRERGIISVSLAGYLLLEGKDVLISPGKKVKLSLEEIEEEGE